MATPRSYRVLAPLIAILMALAPGTISAATGLPELRLNSGARGAALADAMTAVKDLYGASANPAAQITPQRLTVGFGHSAWIQDMQLSQLTVASRRGRTVWSLAAGISQVDGLEERTGPSEQPLGEFGVYAGAFTFSLAREWTPRLRLGASARLIRQSISTATANGAAVDIGMLYRVAPDLQVGLAVRHLGAMSNLQRTATRLPTTVRVGMTFDGVRRLRLTTEVQRPRDQDTSLHAGAEYVLAPGLMLRAGYQTTGSRGFTGGLGVMRGAWSVDYAYVPFTHGLGDTHRVSVQLQR